MQGTSLRTLIESHGAAGFYHKVVELLNQQQLTPDDFSYYELAEACGILPRLRSLRESLLPLDSRLANPAAVTHLLTESSVGTNLFQVITGELIARKVMDGYADDSGFIGDKLVTVLPSKYRNTKIAGFKALAGPTEVSEGQPYEESSFEEKYVTSIESKQGRILSINEELIAFDQTGEIHRRAMALGYYLRQERERTIVRGVIDADAPTNKFVYRPSGTGVGLYLANGSHRNYVGPGNTTSTEFNAAVPLVDWTDIEEVLHYRATQVRDDRTSGDQRPIIAPARQLLVSERLRGTARSIVNSRCRYLVRALFQSTEVSSQEGDRETRSANPLHGMLEVLSSPFVDELGGTAGQNWYVGDFRRQFMWTEIWPVQTFLQRNDSESAFERDVVLRVKARYFGGISAVDTAFVTKVAGA